MKTTVSQVLASSQYIHKHIYECMCVYCPYCTDTRTLGWRNPIQPIGAEDWGAQYDVLAAVKDEPVSHTTRESCGRVASYTSHRNADNQLRHHRRLGASLRPTYLQRCSRPHRAAHELEGPDTAHNHGRTTQQSPPSRCCLRQQVVIRWTLYS